MWERPNRGGGDRVSTISLLGCSTSVASATGPTDADDGWVIWSEGHAEGTAAHDSSNYRV